MVGLWREIFLAELKAQKASPSVDKVLCESGRFDESLQLLHLMSALTNGPVQMWG